MKFKRNEAFRYEFGQPHPITFVIQYLNGKEVNSSTGEAQILDISPGGMKMESRLNLPVHDQLQLFFNLTIGKKELAFPGRIVWHKKFGKVHQYGVQLVSHDFADAIIDALKEYQREMRRK